MRKPVSTRRRVIRLLLNSDPDRVSAGRVADRLFMSGSTLRRRLQAEGTSYQVLLNAVHRHRCEKTLAQRWLPGKCLAGELGFREANSFYRAFLILSAVIMSTIGVMIGLLATGQPFGIVMTGVGVIALAGIVVNNNIVLIDTYDRLIKTAPSPFEAILQTGAQRLRPVFLTTATTALGLLPMALGVSIDFLSREIAFRAPATMFWQMLAFTIIAGLIFSTILTLVVTPCALMLRDRRRETTSPAGVATQQPAE